MSAPNVIRDKIVNVFHLVDNTLTVGEHVKDPDTWSEKFEVFKAGASAVFKISHELATDSGSERELFQRARYFVRRSFYLLKV